MHLVNSVVYTENTFSREIKREDKIYFPFFSKEVYRKLSNNSPLKFIHAYSPFKLENSNVSSFLSAVSEVAERSPFPPFGLSSHQLKRNVFPLGRSSHQNKDEQFIGSR